MSKRSNDYSQQLLIDFNQKVNNQNAVSNMCLINEKNGVKIISINSRREIYRRILNRCSK